MAMEHELKAYLEAIRYRLRLDPLSEREIVRELCTHIEDRVQELREAGLSQDEAIQLATEHFGHPEAIAGEMYRVHSKGTWTVALLAAMPHLFVALFFAFHLWHNLGWLVAGMISMLAISAYGWQHGRPSWSYTWLGYSLMPILIASVASLYALGNALLHLLGGSGPGPNPWVLIGIFAYIPLSVWLLVSFVTKAVRRDWLYGSLMLLPLPAIGCWAFALYRASSLFETHGQYLENFAPWIALSFLTVVMSVAVFFRVERRYLRAFSLAAAGLLVVFIAAQAGPNVLGLLGLVVAALLSVAFLFSPALLENRIRHGEQEEPAWLSAELEASLKQG